MGETITFVKVSEQKDEKRNDSERPRNFKRFVLQIKFDGFIKSQNLGWQSKKFKFPR